jgi:hypothetical protein
MAAATKREVSNLGAVTFLGIPELFARTPPRIGLGGRHDFG